VVFFSLWTQSFISHSALEKLYNLHENPVKAGFVRNPEEWLYSSAVDYYTNNQKGLIDIDLIA
jgi:putative transposase